MQLTMVSSAEVWTSPSVQIHKTGCKFVEMREREGFDVVDFESSGREAIRLVADSQAEAIDAGPVAWCDCSLGLD